MCLLSAIPPKSRVKWKCHHSEGEFSFWRNTFDGWGNLDLFPYLSRLIQMLLIRRWKVLILQTFLELFQHEFHVLLCSIQFKQHENILRLLFAESELSSLNRLLDKLGSIYKGKIVWCGRTSQNFPAWRVIVLVFRIFTNGNNSIQGRNAMWVTAFKWLELSSPSAVLFQWKQFNLSPEKN